MILFCKYFALLVHLTFTATALWKLTLAETENPMQMLITGLYNKTAISKHFSRTYQTMWNSWKGKAYIIQYFSWKLVDCHRVCHQFKKIFSCKHYTTFYPCPPFRMIEKLSSSSEKDSNSKYFVSDFGLTILNTYLFLCCWLIYAVFIIYCLTIVQWNHISFVVSQIALKKKKKKIFKHYYLTEQPINTHHSSY